MKKLIASLLLLTTLVLALTSCNLFSGNDGENPDTVRLRIGYMAGPTGMGMAKLIADNGGLENGNEKYSFTKYADTQAAKTDLAAGKIDIICLPTNEAAAYKNTIDSSAKVLAINCLNSLYFITSKSSEITTISDLEGETIYTCKNGTPRILLEYIIRESGINATISYEIDGKEILTPADLSAQAISGNLPNAVMPEPLVTSTLLKIKSNAKGEEDHWAVKLDFSDSWSTLSDTPITMGCIVAGGELLNNHTSAIDSFLTEYKASVEYIGNPQNIDSAANYVVETGVMAAAPAAKMALTNLGGAICYMDGKDMKEALVSFYNAIGLKLPDDSFYYEK